MSLKYLDAILRYLSKNDYSHKEDIAIQLSDSYEIIPDCTLDDFVKSVKSIRSDFFRINRINRQEFATDVYNLLKRISKPIEVFDTQSGIDRKQLTQIEKKIDQTQETQEIIIRKLDEIQRSLKSNLEELLGEINTMIIEELPATNISSDADGTMILSELRYKIIRQRQEKQIEALELLDTQIKNLRMQLKQDMTMKQRFVSGLKELGSAITTEMIASLIMKFIFPS